MSTLHVKALRIYALSGWAAHDRPFYFVSGHPWPLLKGVIVPHLSHTPSRTAARLLGVVAALFLLVAGTLAAPSTANAQLPPAGGGGDCSTSTAIYRSGSYVYGRATVSCNKPFGVIQVGAALVKSSPREQSYKYATCYGAYSCSAYPRLLDSTGTQTYNLMWDTSYTYATYTGSILTTQSLTCSNGGLTCYNRSAGL